MNKQQDQLPKAVYILNDDGTVSTIPYKELKQHEEYIIEDNVEYGLLHAEYSEQEILDYEKSAKSEWKALKNALRKDPNIRLKLDPTTERYVIASQES